MNTIATQHFTEQATLLRSVRGKRAVAVTLAQSFLGEVERLVTQFKSELRQADYTNAAATAHALKGLVGMYSRTEPYSRCQTLEQSACRQDAEETTSELADLQSRLSGLQLAIEAFIRG